ncbi:MULTISPECIES: DUF5325 family protein [Staphylococcus]|uniref:YlaF family protein n=2 Tax=Staphylococcus TaxID=1279 RepID=A0A1Z3TXT2_9STAP|nr:MULTISPECIES: DUF5325 family protein [Staphylococcus]ASE35811.1 hypothetical protein CEP67_00375 [Staphylococcus pettenkoferi]EHM70579.1 hypothetical protein SEVCU012_0456 [Staphylococcus pettenkoferi VCU012]MBX8993445.1 YlaF family protein [Staphylococcus pettenkoferi]MCI2791315.1 YlaF family protein [Staphylococcus pettenkoferi]MCY1564064.1 YlaF family protein [Staphylococcus pettenkoferi]
MQQKSQKKSKAIFWVLAVLAIVFLTLFSFSIGAGNIPYMILTLILFIATFGVGFSLKKKYRENDWF